MSNLAGLLIPVVIVGLALTLLGVVITFARNYVKCAPNEVLVVFGRKKAGRGYRLITGQGFKLGIGVLNNAILLSHRIQLKFAVYGNR